MKPVFTILLLITVLVSCRDSNDSDDCDVAIGLGIKAKRSYTQMRFSQAYNLLDSVPKMTNNQVELMLTDVLRMRIAQRTADLRIFYRSWHSAENRLHRIDQERNHLDRKNLSRLYFAESEMHTIAATYYYYTHQDSLSRGEMALVAPIIDASHDTLQWTQYLYMMGSGGMVTGDSITIRLSEFDYLLHAYTVSLRHNEKYFEANTLQSLAQCLENRNARNFIKQQRSGGFEYLMIQHADWMQTQCEDSLPLAMVRHSYSLFEQCGDLFQQANVLRTESELLFNSGEYSKSLLPLQKAEMLIAEQHRRDSLNVPYWEARIAERLSLTYSALGDRYLSAVYRNQYLDLIDSMSQDLEEETRTEELAEGNFILYMRLTVVGIIAILLAFVFWLLLRMVRRRGMREAKEMEEQMEMLREETVELREKLEHEKLSHIERRSKVSLAEAVIPYINRMMHTTDLEYVGELADHIMQLNDLLTRWIQVQRGRLSMNITTFSLQPLFDTLIKNSATYTNQGLTLHITPTDAQVKGDKVLTLFMLNTLADNARKFTPEGGTVSVSATALDNYIELSVEDTGCGLSEKDLDTLNNSKVWDAQQLGSGRKEGKGFGFGLMNCKGIISQMKKASSRFDCCRFGVESQIGKGSRFWFRLPRVVTMLVIFFSIGMVHGVAASTAGIDAKGYYDSLYNCNVDGRYEDAMYYGDLALKQIPEDSLVFRMNVENEMAIASEGIRRWDDYLKHNRECMRLHHLLTADPNLPLYAQKLHSLQNEANWALVLTGLIILVSLFIFAMIVRVSRHRRQDASERDDELMLLQEEKNRVQYELDRLHISNQILDNSLSTIKHETMYYPARIRQMVDGENSMEELEEVMSYYNEMYTLLLAQAEKQTEWRMPLDGHVMEYLKGLLSGILRQIENGNEQDDIIWNENDEGRIKTLHISRNGVEIPENLFTPDSRITDALIVREIIRMHDAANGHPGLRLCVENNEIIVQLCKNSKLLS